MEQIQVLEQHEVQDGWEFSVEIGSGVSTSKHKVIVFKTYWEKLTEGSMTPLDLVRKSFVFLLEREPKDSILQSFNLKHIQKYFSEYEAYIRSLS